LTYFSNKHRTLWRSGRQPLAAFRKKYEKSGKCDEHRKKRIETQKRTVHALPHFKRVLEIQKLLVLDG
jgi:hypothetical protein